MDVLEVWHNAIRLSEAWFHLASEYEKKNYRNSGSARRTTALELLMKRELQAKVLSGELYCVGIPLPAPSDGMPRPVPATLFEDVEIDWDKGTISSLGVQYGAVKIYLLQRLETDEISAASPRLKKKMGRPSVDTEILGAIRQLADERAFEGKSGKEKIGIVQLRARLMFPKKFPKEGRPSRVKVMELMKAEGI